MDYIIKHFNDIIAIMGAVIILARLIVKITPSETDNIWLEKIFFKTSRFTYKQFK